MTISNYDERTAMVSAKVSQIVLALTQLALLIAILNRAYLINQPDAEFNDIRIILALSLAGNILASPYFGGHYPVLRPQMLLRIYLVSVVLLFAVLSIWYGFPQLSEWRTTLLPITIGPAIVLALYYLVSRLSERRMQKDLES